MIILNTELGDSNLTCRIFTFEAQLAFSELSGDYNPLHIDEVAARRLLFGSLGVVFVDLVWIVRVLEDSYE